ncbi:DUF421 domain-containing protein [Gilliamella sp. B14384H2]|uniref:DUF421 domain-containing protein n=1 Tax=unclassified Gilliamella TaxID=2685620 RepID=UPI000A437B6A|nr:MULTISPECIES: YetF domain-containing protein [unclassified Gilliamella]MBI0036631.1 DUF421 domain-containing protein [Gilliamella sp. B14384G10]MBI0040758.1 DUF421 domain-containing protein [Gilliamella sp. B14384G7]MBI0050626.1 DUF421 domain-containing protein [Gilliamella sp. B14384G13]MBI0052918.1 DUF421 domain-containing protein [Gilliamella sp. B14384H2]
MLSYLDFLIIALKLLVVFICIVLFLKITGKTSLSQMSSIDFIGNMILGGIAGGIIYNPKLTIYDFIVVLLMWTAIMYSSNYLKKRSQNAKAFIVGNPIILMDQGKLKLDAFTSINLDLASFAVLLRMKNVFTIHDVEKAILEPNGQLSIVKKGDKDISVIVLENEQPVDDVLKQIGKDEKWLTSNLAKQGYKSFQGLYCVEYYDHRLFVIPNDAVK